MQEKGAMMHALDHTQWLEVMSKAMGLCFALISFLWVFIVHLPGLKKTFLLTGGVYIHYKNRAKGRKGRLVVVSTIQNHIGDSFYPRVV